MEKDQSGIAGVAVVIIVLARPLSISFPFPLVDRIDPPARLYKMPHGYHPRWRPFNRTKRRTSTCRAFFFNSSPPSNQTQPRLPLHPAILSQTQPGNFPLKGRGGRPSLLFLPVYAAFRGVRAPHVLANG